MRTEKYKVNWGEYVTVKTVSSQASCCKLNYCFYFCLVNITSLTTRLIWSILTSFTYITRTGNKPHCSISVAHFVNYHHHPLEFETTPLYLMASSQIYLWHLNNTKYSLLIYFFSEKKKVQRNKNNRYSLTHFTEMCLILGNYPLSQCLLFISVFISYC